MGEAATGVRPKSKLETFKNTCKTAPAKPIEIGKNYCIYKIAAVYVLFSVIRKVHRSYFPVMSEIGHYRCLSYGNSCGYTSNMVE